MSELRPEAWLFEPQLASEKSLADLLRRKKEPVTNINTWAQCYAMVAVLAEKHPQFISHFMAYLSIIVRYAGSNRGAEEPGLSWVAYDIAFCRKAAYTKNLCWGVVDQSLFALWLSGGTLTPTCAHCLATDHASAECTYAHPFLPINAAMLTPTPNPKWQTSRPQSSPQPHYQGGQLRTQQDAICGLFNSTSGNRCTYGRECKFAHLCKACFTAGISAEHPASACRRTNNTKRWAPYRLELRAKLQKL